MSKTAGVSELKRVVKTAGVVKTDGVSKTKAVSKTTGVPMTDGMIPNRSTTREDYSKTSSTTYTMTAGRVTRSTNWKDFLM
jgi:hypothetical protein